VAFAHIIFDAFNGNSIWQKYAKIWCLVQMLLPKIYRQISAKMLVNDNSIFGAIYFMLVYLRLCAN
jgi:hypothetical protein